MKICLILEGCYPYIYGGVSAWTHQYIKEMKEHEFILWLVGADGRNRGKFVYELPGNVKEVHEIFLEDALLLSDSGGRPRRFTEKEKGAMEQLMECGRPDWELLFHLYQYGRVKPVSILKSRGFLEIFTELCLKKHPCMAFADGFHTMRSMLLPVLYLLGSPVPEADVYHSVCTGYGGLLAALGSWKYQKPLLLTEHGIYTREREEEIIRAKWVLPSFRKLWIRFFYMLSDVVYSRAFRVTSLFLGAMETQTAIGCAREKCRVIGNGIDCGRFAGIPFKKEDGWVDMGAAVRFAPIKDIKTMLCAFYELSARVKKVRLHIMGGEDDEDYARECRELTAQLEIHNVIFTGRVNVAEYMEKLDFTLLTSISEGQPLSVLESLAAGRPCITTDVGCCRELLEGKEGDTFGRAGFCVPPMHRDGLADAMEKMCVSSSLRRQMGEAGQRRVLCFYRQEQMMEKYRNLYKEVEHEYGGSGI